MELMGFWSLTLVVATRATVPILGTMLAEVHSELTVRIYKENERIIQEQHVCSSILHEQQKLVKTILPEKLIASLPVARFEPVWENREGTWYYEADFGRQALGWNGQGPLPEKPASPNVIDTDQDGQPGVTVLVEAPLVGKGEVWLAQVGHTRVVGKGNENQIQGTVSVPEMDSHVLGASNAMLLHAPTVTFDPHRSFFSMTRVQQPSCH